MHSYPNIIVRIGLKNSPEKSRGIFQFSHEHQPWINERRFELTHQMYSGPNDRQRKCMSIMSHAPLPRPLESQHLYYLLLVLHLQLGQPIYLALENSKLEVPRTGKTHNILLNQNLIERFDARGLCLPRFPGPFWSINSQLFEYNRPYHRS